MVSAIEQTHQRRHDHKYKSSVNIITPPLLLKFKGFKKFETENKICVKNCQKYPN